MINQPQNQTFKTYINQMNIWNIYKLKLLINKIKNLISLMNHPLIKIRIYL